MKKDIADILGPRPEIKTPPPVWVIKVIGLGVAVAIYVLGQVVATLTGQGVIWLLSLALSLLVAFMVLDLPRLRFGRAIDRRQR